MAAGILPRPGTQYGPCEQPCDHVDCRATRQDAASICVYCRREIGFGTRFYRTDLTLVHAACAENAAERQRNG